VISIPIRDERDHEQVLQFKAPGREKWLASANRFLKPEAPSRRITEVYERLLKTCALSTGLSRRILEQLPILALENLYQQLWQSACPVAESTDHSAAVLNKAIHRFLMTQEMMEFRPDVLVREDIQSLSERSAAAMHGYYRAEQHHLSGEELFSFLTGQGCPATILKACHLSNDATNSQNNQAEDRLNRAYWASRQLEGAIGALDWVSLLNSLGDDEAQRYPRLARLRAVTALLKEKHLGGVGVSANQPASPNSEASNIFEAENAFTALLNSPAMRQIGKEIRQARPLKLLILVEGETETRLLPLFAKALGHNLDALGMHLLAAGGKNHMTRLYLNWAEVLAVPICLILDGDAADIAEELQPDLRPEDRLFCFAAGEFEDTYDFTTLLATINRAYHPFPELTPQHFSALSATSAQSKGTASNKGRVAELKTIWQYFRLGSFDKIAFAEHYAETLTDRIAAGDTAKACIAPPIHELFALLLEMRPK
jgi:hypothetical protein